MSGNDTNQIVVERTSLLARLADELEQLAEQSELLTPIINIYGISGIGKTQFVRQALERFRQEYAVVMIDFDPSERADSLQTIAEELRRIPALAYLPALSEPVDTTARPSETYLASYEMTSLPADDKPLLLLLDSLDDLPFWKWIQERIIKPLIDQGNTLVVCTSQSPLFWHFWELRELCESLQLYAFSEDETYQYLRHYDRELLTKTIYRLTFGYPLALERLMQRFDEDPDPDAPWVDLDALSADAREVIEYIGLLRRVDVPVMEGLLATFLPGWSAERGSRQKLYEVLSELQAWQYLEQYRRDRQPYRLSRALRCAVAARVRAAQPDRYVQVCAYLARIYYARAAEEPITEVQSFIEWLYFSIQLLKDDASYTLEAWHAALRQFFALPNLAVASLVALFHEDEVVVRGLREIGQLETVKAILRQHMAEEEDAVPILTEFTISRNDIIEPIADQIAETVPLLGIQRYLDDILQLSAGANQGFDTLWMKDRLNMQHPLNQSVSLRQIDEILILLNRRGLLSYDRQRRTYYPEPIITSLVANRSAHLDPQQYLSTLVRRTDAPTDQI